MQQAVIFCKNILMFSAAVLYSKEFKRDSWKQCWPASVPQSVPMSREN